MVLSSVQKKLILKAGCIIGLFVLGCPDGVSHSTCFIHTVDGPVCLDFGIENDQAR